MATNTKFYVDKKGKYIGGYGDGAVPPKGAIETIKAPGHGTDTWDFDEKKWIKDSKVEKSRDLAELEASISLSDLRKAILGDQDAIDKIQDVEDRIADLNEQT